MKSLEKLQLIERDRMKRYFEKIVHIFAREFQWVLSNTFGFNFFVSLLGFICRYVFFHGSVLSKEVKQI